MTITIVPRKSEYAILESVSYTFSDEATTTELVHQVLTPTLVSLGYHVSSIKRAYENAAAEIAELEDSISTN